MSDELDLCTIKLTVRRNHAMHTVAIDASVSADGECMNYSRCEIGDAQRLRAVNELALVREKIEQVLKSVTPELAIMLHHEMCGGKLSDQSAKDSAALMVAQEPTTINCRSTLPQWRAMEPPTDEVGQVSLTKEQADAIAMGESLEWNQGWTTLEMVPVMTPDGLRARIIPGYSKGGVFSDPAFKLGERYQVPTQKAEEKQMSDSGLRATDPRPWGYIRAYDRGTEPPTDFLHTQQQEPASSDNHIIWKRVGALAFTTRAVAGDDVTDTVAKVCEMMEYSTAQPDSVVFPDWIYQEQRDMILNMLREKGYDFKDEDTRGDRFIIDDPHAEQDQDEVQNRMAAWFSEAVANAGQYEGPVVVVSTPGISHWDDEDKAQDLTDYVTFGAGNAPPLIVESPLLNADNTLTAEIIKEVADRYALVMPRPPVTIVFPSDTDEEEREDILDRVRALGVGLEDITPEM